MRYEANQIIGVGRFVFAMVSPSIKKKILKYSEMLTVSLFPYHYHLYNKICMGIDVFLSGILKLPMLKSYFNMAYIFNRHQSMSCTQHKINLMMSCIYTFL